MGLDTASATVLQSVLTSDTLRKLFKTVADRRIAEKDALAKVVPKESDADQQLSTLAQADLIGASTDGKKYFVTAKGLKVARDLDNLI
jgi:predicted transcriptional regulator